MATDPRESPPQEQEKGLGLAIGPAPDFTANTARIWRAGGPRGAMKGQLGLGRWGSRAWRGTGIGHVKELCVGIPVSIFTALTSLLISWWILNGFYLATHLKERVREAEQGSAQGQPHCPIAPSVIILLPLPWYTGIFTTLDFSQIFSIMEKTLHRHRQHSNSGWLLSWASLCR